MPTVAVQPLTLEAQIQAKTLQLGAVRRDLSTLEAISRQAQTAAEAARAAHRPADLVEASSNATAVETVLNATRATVSTLTAELADLEHQADREAAVLRLVDLSRMLHRAQQGYDNEVQALPGKLAAVLSPAKEAWEGWAELRRGFIAEVGALGVRIPASWEARNTPAVLEPVNALLAEVGANGGNVEALKLTRGHVPGVYFDRSLPLVGNGRPLEAGPYDVLPVRLGPVLAGLIELALTSPEAPRG